jgi:glycine/D-amino acid oxidase-like deaminating enzyme
MAQKIVVIGAGVIGASAAYHLAQAGCDVTVVDAGMGRATDASFGWINASFFADDAHFALRAAGIAAYQNMSQQIDIPVQTPGSLVWEDEGDAFDTQLARLHAVGATVSELDRAAFQKLEPHVAHAPDRIFHFADECVADSGALADGVLAAACGYGAQVISGAQIVEIVEVAGKIIGVQTTLGWLAADQVLIAAGTGTENLLAAFDVTLPMLTRPGVMLRTRPIAPLIQHVLASPTQEVRQLPNGALLAPAAAGHQGDTSDTISGTPADLADVAVDRLRTMLPGHDITWDRIWVANRPMPQDGLPAVGAVGPTGLYAATMHSGITLAALMGDLICTEMTQGITNRSASLLGPYRPRRFGAT